VLSLQTNRPSSARRKHFRIGPVSVEGEKIPIQVEIQNNRLVPGHLKRTGFVVQADRVELAERLAASEITAPGQPVVLESSLLNSEQAGISPVEVNLGFEYKGKIYDLEPLENPGRRASAVAPRS